MANRTNENPRLVMCIEPQTKVRFRYESEGGSHGGLTGKRDGKEKMYPTVKLENYKGKKRIYVKVSLYTEDCEQHVFELKGSSGSVPFLKENLKEDNTATFANIRIVNKKQEEICKLLMEQKFKKMGGNISKVVRAEMEKKCSKEIKERAKEILNSVRLCFEAFEEGNQSRLCTPLFSDVISNQKNASTGDLRIHRMSQCSGSWKGGDEVILLCDKVQKEKIKIEFYEKDMKGNIIWEEPAIFTPADVHYQVAITFKTPQYHQNVEKEVFVRLARGTDYSDSRTFKYIPDFVDKPLKKRKLTESMMETNYSPESSSNYNDTADLCAMKSPIYEELNNLPDNFFEDDISGIGLSLEQLQHFYPDLCLPFDDTQDTFSIERVCNQSLDCVDGKFQIDISNIKIAHGQMYISENVPQINKLSQDAQRKQLEIINSLLKKTDNSGNTLLHYSVFKDKEITNLLTAIKLVDFNIMNVQNCNRETVLHVATKLNKIEVVKRLLKCKANPNIKNKEGNSCYHIAAENDLFEIMFCLLSFGKYSPQLDTFNYKGLSPMHLAIKNKSEDCFNLLKTHSANICTREQISGRSLLHYAVEFWPSFLTTLLSNEETCKLINIQDYEGNTPLHLASAFENIQVVKQLLDAGADSFLKNYKQCSDDEENSEDAGQTAINLTTHPEILEMLQNSSNHISVINELIKELCKLLDVNERWKCLAQYYLDEKFINSLQCSESPTKALVEHVKKEYKETFIENLKNVVEIAELKDILKIFKEKNL